MISKSYSKNLMEQIFFAKLLFLAVYAVLPITAVLYLYDLELSVLKSPLLTGTSSLLNCHKLTDVSE